MSGTSQSSPSEQNDFLLNKLAFFSTAAPQPLKGPSLSPADLNASYSRVHIAGQLVPAMIISGEPRVPVDLLRKLCLPALEKKDEKTSPAGFSEFINQMNIHTHMATMDQIHQLRRLDEELMQERAVCIELITMTDAERIFGLLREESNELPELNRASGLSNVFEKIPVSHWISGDEPIKGNLYPARKGGRCIQCEECTRWFTPEHFIVHHHSDNLEKMRIVHWGLCTDNWRHMIVLSPDTMEDITLNRALEQFMLDDTPSQIKRSATDDDECVPIKRPRVSSFLPPFKASAELASVLESATQLPKLNTDLFASPADAFLLRNNEAKFRVKATAEAMKGDLFDVGCSGKGLSQQSIQEKAQQALRCQLPYFPDPESFPKKQLPNDCTSQLMDASNKLKALEETLFEGKSTQERQAMEEVRTMLHQMAYQNQQQDAIYGMLLCSYKMITAFWRFYVDPTQPIPGPYDSDYAAFAKTLSALDPMNLMGSTMIKGVQTVDIPPGPSSSTQKSPQINGIDSQAMMMAAMIRQMQQSSALSPAQKSFMAPQINSNALLSLLNPDSVANLVKNIANGGFKAPLPASSSKTMNSLLQPTPGLHLPTTPAQPGLLSTKQMLFQPDSGSEAFRRLNQTLMQQYSQ